jgi:transposase
MFEPVPLGLSGGRWSDQHGVIERHPTLALSRSFLDPRDIAAHRSFEEHGPQIPAFGQRRTEVCHPDRPSKLDPYADKLSHMLRQEAGKSRKQKRTTKQLHADLATLGYDGSYNRVAAFARDWKAARQQEQKTCGRGVFVPLAFLPGEAFQFDWSEDWAIIAGERTKLQVAHFKLSCSRAFVLRAYPQQTHEMLFDAHNHAFRVLGGVPRRGIYDNMRTAVDKVGRGKERQVNARFSAMVSHFLFEADFCNPASGWEKGQIEKNV